MNYQNPFFNPYGFMQQQPQMPQPAQPPVQIVKVSGENGARAYQMGANSSALLLDETQPVVWLKTTDGASYATLVPYKITPLEREDPVKTNMDRLEERIAKIEEKVFSVRNVQFIIQNR